MKSDLEVLTDEQLENFKLDKFQYWNYNSHKSDSTFNIPFRLFGSSGLKSDVNCSIYWKNNPDGYPNYLTTVNMKDVTKIEVYKGTANAASGSYVGCIVFYNGETIIGAAQ